MRISIQTRQRATALAAAVAALAGLSGCLGGDGNETTPTGPSVQVQLGLTPVNGAACTLTDNSGKALAASVTSQSGMATFARVTSSAGLALVSCSGGSYADAASGKTLSVTRWRGYATVPAVGSAATSTTVVTPLTELAVRLLGTQGADSQYATTRSWVARAFGLGTLDIGAVPPTDLSSTAATDTAASRHGVALAALSQLELQGSAGASTEALVAAFAANFDSHGYPKDQALPLAYGHAIEALLANARLGARLGSAGNAVARGVFDSAVHVEPLATILYVDGDDSPTGSGDDAHLILPGVPSTLAIGGHWMHMGLDVKLAGGACTLHDLLSDDHEESTGEQELTAECPAQPAGKAVLTVSDAGNVVSQTELTVAATARHASANRARALAAAQPLAAGTGAATVAGTVTALAPTVDTTTGAHNYASPRTFTVKGVVVELLDRSAGDAVLMQTSTDGNGQYQFQGVDAGKTVVVRVKAQLFKTRAAGVSTGAQWNLAVRDNTSTTSPKALYALDSAAIVTTAGNQTQDISAGLGFAADGAVGTDDARKSAPFSILEVAYSAMSKIEGTDANVVFPDVNFYWSPKNVGTDGSKEQGQIGTSHYDGSGLLPGVFILGKADVDTDEFDQGVIGHEFGHWLQSVLSSDDNPGGSHANAEFKDASLAYGEGYGTAVGGLLSGSPYYIDTSGVKQSGGGVTNLDLPSKPGVRKGFYSEESVGYLMYQVGKRHGFNPFWKAVSAMKADHYSSTIYAFLNRFVSANPDAAVADLLTTESIRSTDPLGRLPAGAVADATIAAAQNKGASATGAADLEALYIPVTLATVAVGTDAVSLTAANPPTFCINHNLKGAALSNGLGMLKRFTFKANFTGSLGIKVADDKGSDLDGKDVSVLARADATGKASIFVWDNAVKMNVQDGVSYTVRVQQTQANIFQGNRCGNTLSLWRLPA